MSSIADIRDLNAIVREAVAPFHLVRQEMHKVLVGQQPLIDRLLIALLTNGHILLEGLPGLAKTLSITTLAQIVGCDFKRIQFTPDLLPADLVGTSIYNPKDGTFTVKKGPIFTNFFLGDEINRAPAKVQSALLEMMAEKQATILGTTFMAPDPFLVLATQNPIEQEGTYPLPEAQTDRFMFKVLVHYPTKTEEKEIIRRMACFSGRPQVQKILDIQELIKAQKIIDDIYIDDKVTDYILDVVFATRNPKEYGLDLDGVLEYGASPRASIALTLASKAHAFLAGRGFVTPHDVKSIGRDVLRHRIRLSYEGEARELNADEIINRIFETLLVP